MKVKESMIKAVIYARFSSHNQREESLDAQVRACMERAKQLGYTVIEVYKDFALSATSDNRPEFQRMIADAEKKKFNVLLVHKLDRFSRDRYDSANYKRKLKIFGVQLMSVTENLDGSPESIILESVIEGMGQYYSANLAREVSKGQRETALQCKHLGGFPPLGYDVDPITRQYVINETEAKIIRLIFEKYSNGVGYNQILEYLNNHGFLTKSYTNKAGVHREGKPFSKGSLNTILKSEKYVGTFVFNRKLEKDVTGKRRPEWRPEEEWIKVENGMPAIIDRETFDKVQIKLAVNHKNGGKFKAKEVYLLSSLVVCGECGSSMYGNTRNCGRSKSKYSSYRCSNRANHKGCSNKEIRKEYLDNCVLDMLHDKLFSTQSIKKLATMLSDYNRKQSASNKGEVSQVQRESQEIQGKINTIVRLVAESGISIETVKDEIKALEDRQRFLSDYLKELMLKDSAMITDEVILDLINRSKDFVKTKNIPQCRNFIENYVEKVVVYSDHVEVFFKINVPDDSTDSTIPLKSEEGIKVIQKDYRKTV